MKRKTLHTWLSCVALLLACLMVLTVLAGCKNPSENPTGTGTGDGTSTCVPDALSLVTEERSMEANLPASINKPLIGA